VRIKARLVDTRTGLLLWEGEGAARQGSGGSGSFIGDLISAAVSQAITSSTDNAHQVSRKANANLFNAKDRGLLSGPYWPAEGG